MASEPWVSVDDVAKHLGVAKESVYRWIEGRRLSFCPGEIYVGGLCSIAKCADGEKALSSVQWDFQFGRLDSNAVRVNYFKGHAVRGELALQELRIDES